MSLPKDEGIFYRKHFFIKEYEIPPYGFVEDYIFGDYIDVIYSSVSISELEISINNGRFVTLSKMIPCRTPFFKYAIRNMTGSVVKLILIVGREYFRIASQTVRIVDDLVGLAKESTLSSLVNALISETEPRCMTVSLTANTPKAIGSGKFKMLIIQNNSNVDVYLGTSDLQNIRIPANGGTFTIAFSGDKYGLLDKLYLRAPSDTSVEVMYWV